MTRLQLREDISEPCASPMDMKLLMTYQLGEPPSLESNLT